MENKIANKIALKFRKEWDKNNYSFSDGKSIEIWIRQTLEDELSPTSERLMPKLSENETDLLTTSLIEKLALAEFPIELNKEGEHKTMVAGQKYPHGFRKFFKGYIKGFRKSQELNKR